MAIANQTKTIVGVFNSVQDAQRAVSALESAGVARDQISVIANKNATGYETGDGVDKTSDVVADAGIGAAIGGVGGLLLAAAGAITIPIIGPILAAGPIAAALTGAGIGAAAGGMVGALTEHGVPEDHAKYYAEGVRRGDVLLTVHADESMVDRVSDILDDNGAADVDERVNDWKSRGWSGYQDTATPMTSDELRTERSYYNKSGAISSTGVSGLGVDRGRAGSTPDLDRDGIRGDNSIERGAGQAGDKMKEWGHDAKSGLAKAGDKIEDAWDSTKQAVKNTGHDIADSTRTTESERRYRARVYDRRTN